MVTNSGIYGYADEPLWFRILWLLSSGDYASNGIERVYVAASGKVRSINRRETDETIKKIIKNNKAYMARKKNKNVSGMYVFILDDKRKNDDCDLLYDLNQVRLDAFIGYSPVGAKSKLANRKGVKSALVRTGGIDFIKEGAGADLRSKTIGIDDDALKKWLNNLFNYYIHAEVTEYFYFTSPNSGDDDIFEMIRIHPRVILRYAICDWEAPQFPKKDYLAKKVFDFVAMNLIQEWKYQVIEEKLRKANSPIKRIR